VAEIASQRPVAFVMAIVKIASGGKPDEVLDFMMTPVGFMAMAAGPQLALLTIWWLATTFGDPRTRRHRAIGRCTLSVPAYVCIVLASPAVLVLGEPLYHLAVRAFGKWQSDELFTKLFDNMTWPIGLALVVFIAIAPGFVEELFFRGYMQRRLLDRWSPAVVVPLVAVLFSAFHGTPAWALAVLPLALWFGILAWRTGSLWPSIACHMFINGSVNLWRVGAAMDAWPSELSRPIVYSGLGASSACLLVSLWLLLGNRGETEKRPATTQD
jgi:membrane protease YdiL (CAAX protease family)